ncbi:MAG: S8 family serine peptidase [Bacteroidota bacterium]|nr:S8 family serine peptidase [Bacteroidota bacterium]
MSKKIIIAFFLLFGLLPTLLFGDNSPHKSGQLIVMLKAGQSVESLKQNYSLDRVQVLAKRSGIYLVQFDPFVINEDVLLKKIKEDETVAIAQFNHFVHLRGIPDDLQFGTQYALNNTGQSGGTVDADIDAPEAWDITTGGLTVQGDTIVVAIVDDGFQLTHPDLAFWKNYNEIAANGTDDDGNGFIDDVNGWNVFTHNGNISNAQHGTHVAGIVGAKGNNAMGVSGVNWNVKLMPVVGATELESEAIEAYSYVLECRRLYNETNGVKGAFVVASNSSFGVDMGQPSNFPIWCAYYDSLGKVGVLSAAATANNNWNIDVVGDIPCSCNSNYLLTVSCTGRNDTKVLNAGYGINTIDLGAPGHQILSTYPSNTYTTLTGTSMASPHVAGSVALMYSAACDTFIQDYKLFPDSFALVMRDFLMNSVDPKNGFDTLFLTGGRLNVFNAVQAVQQYGNCSSVGLNQEMPKEMVFGVKNMFPNPTMGLLHLNYVSDVPGFYLEVIDIVGRVVKVFSLPDVLGNNELIMDCNNLQSAVYFIRLRTDTSVSPLKKLIKID